MTEGDDLVMWTIYERPRDFPNGYVARRWLVVRGNPEPVPTNEVITGATLDEVREPIARLGLVCLARNDGDETPIVETWL